MTDNDISILELVCKHGSMADAAFYRQKDIGADTRLDTLLSNGLIKKNIFIILTILTQVNMKSPEKVMLSYLTIT